MNKIIELKRGGIYKISNTINSKVYIGSAIKFTQRIIRHESDFKIKRHNKIFQNFVNKYGIDTLIFEIIEFVEDKKMLLEREQIWINKYQSFNSKFGYNICLLAGSPLGTKMPQSHKEACKKRMSGNKIMLGHKWTKKERKEIGKRSEKAWANNPDKLKAMGEKIGNLKRGIPIWNNKNHPMLGKEHPSIRTIAIYRNGTKIDEVKGINQVAEKYSLDSAAVSRVCNKKLRQTKGYYLEYINASINIKNYCLTNKSGGLHRSKSVEMFAIAKSMKQKVITTN